MRYEFQTEQWLPYPPELVFAFFVNPENLPRLMPRWQQARIEQAHIAPPPPCPEGTPRYPGLAAGSGTRLIIGARPLPFFPAHMPWEALIEDFRWNEGFCDVQVRGPFKYWRHCHTVSAAPSPSGDATGTLLRDHVEYELPLGPLNGVANTLGARPGMAYIFGYRQRRTAELLRLMTQGRR